MGKYTVEIIPKAEKEFLKLPEKVKTSIIKDTCYGIIGKGVTR